VKNSRPFTAAAALVVELQREMSSGAVRMTLSLPGRDGTSSRTWEPLAAGMLTTAQFEDVCTAVGNVVDEWLLLSGAQAQLWHDLPPVTTEPASHVLERLSHLPGVADTQTPH
jgi:hypothetical protein